MKNTTYNILYILILLVLMACESELNQIPPNNLVEANVIVDQKSAEAALIGTMQPLERINPSPFGADYISNGAHMVGFLSGNFDKTDSEAIVNVFTTSNGWDQCSDIINAANLVIEKTALVSNSKFEQGRKEEIIAEARFMRFFAQYYLFRHYGQFWKLDSPFGALMRREPSKLSTLNHKRATVTETYTLLLEDLNYVIQKGAEFSTVYRPSSLLAKAYKAELLIMRGTNEDLQEAITIADEVLNDGKRSIEATYEAIFEKGYESSELLFTRFLDANSLNFVFRNVDSIIRLFNGEDGFEMTSLFLDVLGNDARLPLYYNGIDINKVPKLYKEDGNCLPYYMRISQMYLIKAEAHARLQQKNQAIEAINVLRVRAGEIPINQATIADNELNKTVFEEICKEMAMEKGYEWLASIRLMNNANQAIIFDIKTEVTSENQFIWPIPVDEVRLNMSMVQNPGYENL
ncbi:SusD/RagB family lipoprotein precursor [Tenacibaculum sp. 190524A02b]|uniref:Starch-binding outer membrane protein, SusD/RagB family n=1 Tax=Tenacibaculum vairaonense TaxID=3137860 RepID=A0ABM9PS04_9FLAO